MTTVPLAPWTGPTSKPTSALWDRALRDLQALRGKRGRGRRELAATGLKSGVR